jgi:hypothetical protein
MRAIHVFVALSLTGCGFAQGVTVFGGFSAGSGPGGGTISGSGQIRSGGSGGVLAGRPIGTGSLQVNLRSEPQPFLRAGITTSYRGSSLSGTSYFTRTVMDSVTHEYFGYEVLLEEQQPGTYRATFGPSGFTSMEMASKGAPAKDWSLRAPALPASQIVHDGDVISVELMADAATGEKLIEDITIQPFSQRLPMAPLAPATTGAIGFAPQPASRTVPTVEGPARDFSAGDAEMRLAQPRLTINGIEESFTQTQTGPGGMLTSIPLNRNASGQLVWFYVPGKGRYILSLIARPELEFKKAGELRGGRIKFTVGADTFTLECPNEIAEGHAPYNLYVLSDPLYEPTSQRQKGQFAVGSVGVEELVMLKRQ